VGQSLSAILMETENAQEAESATKIAEHLASVKRLAEKTVNEVRDLALLLRPSMLDDFGRNAILR
jgi:signal transduction histidine kinase